MKQLIFILFIVNSFLAKAQDTAAVTNFYFDFYYGYRLQEQGFYDQLNTVKSIRLNSPLQLVGIRACDYLHQGKKMDILQNFSYTQVLPHTIQVQDTIKGKITGCVWGIGIGGLLISRHLNFHYYIGFNAGRLRMHGNELIRQKNPFFSPKAGIQPWFKFGRMAITAIVEYEYDVSKTSWRRTWFANSNKVTVDRFRQTGLTAQLGVSFMLDPD